MAWIVIVERLLPNCLHDHLLVLCVDDSTQKLLLEFDELPSFEDDWVNLLQMIPTSEVVRIESVESREYLKILQNYVQMDPRFRKGGFTCERYTSSFRTDPQNVLILGDRKPTEEELLPLTEFTFTLSELVRVSPSELSRLYYHHQDLVYSTLSGKLTKTL